MTKKILLIFTLLILLSIGLLLGLRYWNYIYSPNTNIADTPYYITIPSNSEYNDLLSILEENKILKDLNSFNKTAEFKDFKNKINTGRYAISQGMSNNDIINLIRSGNQSPVNLTFISLRSLELLSSRTSKYIETDSTELYNYLKDTATASKFGFTDKTFLSMFIPNTYEFFWNTSAEKFASRMHNEYTKFWNSDRLDKAKQLSLSPIQVSILASIVEAETQKNDEKARIAGVYINRLKIDMPLQADPTVVFANGDFTIKRVLNKHLEKDSPYNTYIYKGLPPGPINIPSISSIDAVLNYENHKYLFFCAKEDLSGYHAFARTLSEHLKNARKYHAALKEAGIK